MFRTELIDRSEARHKKKLFLYVGVSKFHTQLRPCNFGLQPLFSPMAWIPLLYFPWTPRGSHGVQEYKFSDIIKLMLMQHWNQTNSSPS